MTDRDTCAGGVIDRVRKYPVKIIRFRNDDVANKLFSNNEIKQILFKMQTNTKAVRAKDMFVACRVIRPPSATNEWNSFEREYSPVRAARCRVW